MFANLVRQMPSAFMNQTFLLSIGLNRPLSFCCDISASGKLLMFPKENSRSFLWKHEKDGTSWPRHKQFFSFGEMA